MLLTGIGMMGYKLVATQFSRSTRVHGFAVSQIMRTEFTTPTYKYNVVLNKYYACTQHSQIQSSH